MGTVIRYWMDFTIAALVAGILVFAVVTPAQSEGNVVGSVKTSGVCLYGAIMELANAIRDGDKNKFASVAKRRSVSGECFNLGGPRVIEVYEVRDGPFKDDEGDRFYVVRVGDDVYTIAWPGHNASIVEPASVSLGGTGEVVT